MVVAVVEVVAVVVVSVVVAGVVADGGCGCGNRCGHSGVGGGGRCNG